MIKLRNVLKLSTKFKTEFSADTFQVHHHKIIESVKKVIKRNLVIC